MRALQWIVGGSVGALVGIALWATVVHLTGYEVGLAAAFLGIFVGAGIAAAAGPDRGVGAALFAGAFALLAVLGGKATVAWVSAQQTLAEQGLAPGEITDEFLISCLADDLVWEYEWEGYALEYPPGADLDFPDAQTDYPTDIWAQAESQWHAMSPDEQATLRATVEFGAGFAPAAAFILTFLFSFGLFDLLWIGLAVSSAYRIVKHTPTHPGPAAFAPTHSQTPGGEAPVSLPGLPPPTGAPSTLHGQPHEQRPLRNAG